MKCMSLLGMNMETSGALSSSLGVVTLSVHVRVK